MLKYKKPIKIKSKYKIERSNEPGMDGTHILWYESETEHGYSFRRVFKGSYQECLIEKEKREKNVRKPKSYSFKLLKRALHNK